MNLLITPITFIFMKTNSLLPEFDYRFDFDAFHIKLLHNDQDDIHIQDLNSEIQSHVLMGTMIGMLSTKFTFQIKINN